MIRLKVKDAAKILGKAELFVRCGIISGKLPIGTAIQVSGRRYSYHVSPGKLAEYLGVTVEEIEKEVRSYK